MTKCDKLDPNSSEYTNALLEDIDDKFQAILEATLPIPGMQAAIERIEKWEERVDLIPSIFEEVGSLRKDVEVLKRAHELLDRHDKQLVEIDRRLSVVEQKVGA